MTTFWAITLFIWGVGAFSGFVFFFVEESTDAADYAKSVLWPIFLLIWLWKGSMRALKEALK